MAMSNSYFAADWIITAVAPPFELAEVAETLGAELVSLHPFNATDEGYEAATLVLRVPTNDVLQTLTKISAEKMGLIRWDSVSEALFLEGKKIRLDRSAPGLINARNVDVWFFAARRNTSIRDGFKGL
jgi:hypothetical protein